MWGLVAIDPEFVPDVPVWDALERHVQRWSSLTSEAYCLSYPTSVFWGVQRSQRGEPVTDVHCPVCGENVAEWFDGLDTPEFNMENAGRITRAVTPCCGSDVPLSDLDFGDEGEGFARFFLVLNEDPETEWTWLQSDPDIDALLSKASAIAGCGMVMFRWQVSY